MATKTKGFKKIGKTAFWLLGEFSWVYRARVVNALLLGYVSEAAYDAGEHPIASELHTWSGADFDLFDATKAMDKQIEDAILLREEWVGAEVTDKDI